MLHLLKRLTFYFVIFFLLVFFNIYVSITSHAVFSRQNQIQAILNEINDIKNNRQYYFSSFLPPETKIQGEAKLADGRVSNLKAFFRKYNSPLYDYAEKIVEVSDKYQFDYRLIPAIAMQESNLCKYIPENSYNCWGWGIYGDQVIHFSSYNEAIETVAQGLKKEYLDKGLVTASQIMRKYTPPSRGSWAHGVNTFIKALE